MSTEAKRAYWRMLYQRKDKAKLAAQKRDFRREHPEKAAEYAKRYAMKHPEKIAAYMKSYKPGWQKRNRERMKLYSKRHYDKRGKARYAELWRTDPSYRIKLAGYGKIHRARYPEKVKGYRRKFYRENYGTNLNYTIRRKLSGRLRHALRNGSGKRHCGILKLLGCSVPNFRVYIQSKFEPGMTWENIHLDHIIPCALFDLTKLKHQKLCFHFSNFQPLFAMDNFVKGARILQPEIHEQDAAFRSINR